jgi:hypothetical protein
MLTTLTNLHNLGTCHTIIDRTSIFGNPFKIGVDGDRIQVIEKYREWFYKRILTDAKFRDRIHSLKGHVLGCWCVPELCHGMVIIEYLEGIPYNKEKKEPSVEFFTI